MVKHMDSTNMDLHHCRHSNNHVLDRLLCLIIAHLHLQVFIQRSRIGQDLVSILISILRLPDMVRQGN